jgi:hypothetical protein
MMNVYFGFIDRWVVFGVVSVRLRRVPGLYKNNKAIAFTGNRFISSIGISFFKVKRLFSG